MSQARHEDLPGLPPGSRLVLRALGEYARDLDDEDVARIQERLAEAWRRDNRVFVLHDFDLFIVRPDGRVSGTAPRGVGAYGCRETFGEYTREVWFATHEELQAHLAKIGRGKQS